MIKDTLYEGVLAAGHLRRQVRRVELRAHRLRDLVFGSRCSTRTAGPRRRPGTRRMALGAKAKEKGKYLFVWGKEAATYYQTMAIASAIKEGGDDVRLALENLKPDCWSQPAMQAVFTALEKIIDAGYFKPGGSGTQFTAAQAQWSNDAGRDALPVRVLDRERDEEADQGRLQDDRRPRAGADLRQQDAVRGAAQRGRRAVRRPVAGQERGRRQGTAADHALQGRGDQLRQDQAGADHRQGHRAGGRLRFHRTGVPDQDARCRRVEDLHLELRRPATA